MKDNKLFVEKIVDAVGDSLPADFDKEGLAGLLMRAAAEEIQAWYQYLAPTKFAVGPERQPIVQNFLKTAFDELDDHFNKLMERLAQLDVDVTPLTDLWNLRNLSDAYVATQAPYDVRQLLEKAMVSEEKAIRTYKEILDFCNGKDAVTYELARHIMADEEEHLTNFHDFLNDISQ